MMISAKEEILGKDGNQFKETVHFLNSLLTLGYTCPLLNKQDTF